MRHSRRNGLIAAVVAGGGLAVAGAGGFAFADAEAGGQAVRSPGVLSGNLLQLPVHTPVNVCGNTVSVVGVLNSAAGNRCVNADRGAGKQGEPGHPGPRSSDPSHPSKPGAGNGAGNGGQSGHGGPGRGAVAEGRGKDSPGLLSGNGLQLPVEVPVNISGNSVSVVGVGNSSVGNTSVNGSTPVVGKPVQPPVRPPVAVRPVTPPAPPRSHPSALAHTGAEGAGYLLSGGGAMLLGGVLLYRRFRLN
ncbi:chaplin [Streptomyces sp. NBC_00347]|uniref:chaplin n=1 Tax=Streptomyces sp. NBC_00347 TaxID=2975721 RepID=UPI00202E9661|nr:chaplin [Streptomyces sp. NBC_00347]MCM1976427.1 chaplin [Streptomyces sp. G1]